jgi:steroid delta-isomerase-like uncharacterized protein
MSAHSQLNRRQLLIASGAAIAAAALTARVVAPPVRSNSPERSNLMSTEQNKATFRRFFEALNQRNFALLDEIFDTNVVYNVTGLPEPMRGPEGVKQLVNGFRAAFPDIQVTVEEMIAEGDKVVARVTARGTNHGELMGNVATGKRAEWYPVHIARFADGKIVEDRITYDQLGFLQQLGLVPAPEPAK